MASENDRYLVPGLLRGLSVLQSFSPETPQLRLTDIAQRLGISRSAAFRTVYTLADAGYLLHDARTNSYALGPAVLGLSRGYVATREIVEIARPVLEELRAAAGWSVHMAVLDGTSILYLLRLPGPRAQPGLVHVGSRLPASSTTMGRVLLADLPREEIVARYRERQDRAAGAAPLSRVLQQADADRGAPVIRHVGDFEAGIASVAAPVRDITGRVIAAVSLTTAVQAGGAASIPDSVCGALKTAADRVSLLLGFSGSET